MPSLILISEDYPRQVFELGRATLMIGRGDASTIQMRDDSISRNHASIVYQDQNYVVRDNGSTNGTFVNGERVNQYILRHHDMIRFGSCLFLVDMTGRRKGPHGTEVLEVTHVGSKDGNVIEISPKPLFPGEEVKAVKVILASKPVKDEGTGPALPTVR